MRLIDADKLIEYWKAPPMCIGYDDEIEDVNNQPTVEAYSREKVASILNELKHEITQLKSYESSDGQDLVMLADIGILLDGKISALIEMCETCRYYESNSKVCEVCEDCADSNALWTKKIVKEANHVDKA